MYVRARQNGDSYRYSGMTHKLKKVFNDRGIPPIYRERFPILCDDKGIVWVPGLGVRDDGAKGSSLIVRFATKDAEDGELALFKTHYYGGIKKYQWTAIPLALHGVVVKQNGEVVTVVIGEKDSDPVMYITDLLPHLAANYNTKPLGSAISGESLNILVGGIPCVTEDSEEKIKYNLCDIFYV